MRNLIPLVLVGVLGGSTVVLVAEPPANKRGKVLILENERVLEGDIEQDGGQYRIRRSLGETWVPAERVLIMCQDKEEGYRFLCGRANLHDPDERLRLAHWCHLNGLPSQALAEIEAAVKLRPGHRPSQRLLTHLQQAAAARPVAAPTSPPDLAETAPAPPIDLTEDALGQFATRVQPILMNTCAGCHAVGKGGTFRLTRTYDATLLNRKALQQNLAAVLGQVNTSQPQASPFLTKSVSVHGNLTQSPLKNRQAVAYRTLEDWVKRAVGDNPQLREPAPRLPPAIGVIPPPPARVVPRTPVEPATGNPRDAIPPAPRTRPAEKTPPRAEEKPADPFDPAEFNKLANPSR